MRQLLLFGLLITRLSHASRPLCREAYGKDDEWRDCRVQIGGLAIQGPDAFEASLGPTFRDFLTDRYNESHGLEFEALPLNFNENFDFVSAGDIDFIYSNPGAYTCLMVEFKVITIASLMNFRKGNALERFAGVIFSRADSNFSTVEDLRRARVEAVSISGLGAMQLQQAQLLDFALDVMTDVKRLTFAYNQNKIVQDVENGYADVGFVRTDMIDRSVDANKTKWEYFQVINEIPDDTFPFDRSTAFTPEWPVGALPHVPFEISELVSVALFQLDRFSEDPTLADPAIAGNYATWVTPMNYLELLSMLEKISYYDPAAGKCLRSSDVYEAIRCPAGYVKQAEENVFCPDDCKEGYTCLCQPCTQLLDPEIVLSAEALPTDWLGIVDVAGLEPMTTFESECQRMAKCVEHAEGQRMQWSLTDRIGEASRLQINAPLIETVEMRLTFDAEWAMLSREDYVLPEGTQTQRYVLNSTGDAAGTHTVQIRINGEQASMSPVVVVSFPPPHKQITCGPGEELEDDGSCAACPPGSHGVVVEGGDEYRSTCQLCAPGSAQPLSNQSSCVLCPSGQRAPERGATTCTACPAGSSTLGKEGRSECTPCEPGQQAPSNGSPRCGSCPRGRYSTLEGAESCDACLGGTTTLDVAARNASACACAEGQYYAVTGSGGQCRTCLLGTVCPGFGSPPLLLPKYYMEPDAPRDAWDLDVWECTSSASCPGQGDPSDPACSGLLQGINCAKCPAGHSHIGRDDCTECSPAALQVFFGMSGALAAFFCIGVVAKRAMQTRPITPRILMLVLAAGFALTLFQILGILSLLSVTWPSMFRSVLSSSQLMLIDTESIQLACAFSHNIASSYIFPLMLPILGIGFCLAWYPLSQSINMWCPGWFPVLKLPILLNIYGSIWQAGFISMVSSVVMIFDCYESPNGKSTVRGLPYAVCWEGEHQSMVPVGVIAMLVYVCGFMATYCVLAFVAPRQYHSPAFRLATKFMTKKYQARTWWFGIVLQFRSAMLAMVTMVVPNDAYPQFHGVLLILVASLALHLIYQPYAVRGANIAEGLQLGLLIFMVTLGFWFIQQESSPHMHDSECEFLDMLIMMCFTTNLVSLGIATAWEWGRHWIAKYSAQPGNTMSRFAVEFKALCALVAETGDSEILHVLQVAGPSDIIELRRISNFLILELCRVWKAETAIGRLPAMSIDEVNAVQVLPAGDVYDTIVAKASIVSRDSLASGSFVGSVQSTMHRQHSQRTSRTSRSSRVSKVISIMPERVITSTNSTLSEDIAALRAANKAVEMNFAPDRLDMQQSDDESHQNKHGAGSRPVPMDLPSRVELSDGDDSSYPSLALSPRTVSSSKLLFSMEVGAEMRIPWSTQALKESCGQVACLGELMVEPRAFQTWIRERMQCIRAGRMRLPAAMEFGEAEFHLRGGELARRIEVFVCFPGFPASYGLDTSAVLAANDYTVTICLVSQQSDGFRTNVRAGSQDSADIVVRRSKNDLATPLEGDEPGMSEGPTTSPSPGPEKRWSSSSAGSSRLKSLVSAGPAGLGRIAAILSLEPGQVPEHCHSRLDAALVDLEARVFGRVRGHLDTVPDELLASLPEGQPDGGAEGKASACQKKEQLLLRINEEAAKLAVTTPEFGSDDFPKYGEQLDALLELSEVLGPYLSQESAGTYTESVKAVALRHSEYRARFKELVGKCDQAQEVAQFPKLAACTEMLRVASTSVSAHVRDVSDVYGETTDEVEQLLKRHLRDVKKQIHELRNAATVCVSDVGPALRSAKHALDELFDHIGRFASGSVEKMFDQCVSLLADAERQVIGALDRALASSAYDKVAICLRKLDVFSQVAEGDGRQRFWEKVAGTSSQVEALALTLREGVRDADSSNMNRFSLFAQQLSSLELAVEVLHPYLEEGRAWALQDAPAQDDELGPSACAVELTHMGLDQVVKAMKQHFQRSFSSLVEGMLEGIESMNYTALAHIPMLDIMLGVKNWISSIDKKRRSVGKELVKHSRTLCKEVAQAADVSSDAYDPSILRKRLQNAKDLSTYLSQHSDTVFMRDVVGGLVQTSLQAALDTAVDEARMAIASAIRELEEDFRGQIELGKFHELRSRMMFLETLPPGLFTSTDDPRGQLLKSVPEALEAKLSECETSIVLALMVEDFDAIDRSLGLIHDLAAFSDQLPRVHQVLSNYRSQMAAKRGPFLESVERALTEQSYREVLKLMTDEKGHPLRQDAIALIEQECKLMCVEARTALCLATRSCAVKLDVASLDRAIDVAIRFDAIKKTSSMDESLADLMPEFNLWYNQIVEAFEKLLAKMENLAVSSLKRHDLAQARTIVTDLEIFGLVPGISKTCKAVRERLQTSLDAVSGDVFASILKDLGFGKAADGGRARCVGGELVSASDWLTIDEACAGLEHASTDAPGDDGDVVRNLEEQLDAKVSELYQAMASLVEEGRLGKAQTFMEAVDKLQLSKAIANYTSYDARKHARHMEGLEVRKQVVLSLRSARDDPKAFAALLSRVGSHDLGLQSRTREMLVARLANLERSWEVNAPLISAGEQAVLDSTIDILTEARDLELASGGHEAPSRGFVDRVRRFGEEIRCCELQQQRSQTKASTAKFLRWLRHAKERLQSSRVQELRELADQFSGALSSWSSTLEADRSKLQAAWDLITRFNLCSVDPPAEDILQNLLDLRDNTLFVKREAGGEISYEKALSNLKASFVKAKLLTLCEGAVMGEEPAGEAVLCGFKNLQRFMCSPHDLGARDLYAAAIEAVSQKLSDLRKPALAAVQKGDMLGASHADQFLEGISRLQGLLAAVPEIRCSGDDALVAALQDYRSAVAQGTQPSKKLGHWTATPWSA